MEFYRSKLVKAGRKIHRCESCNRDIPVGAPRLSEVNMTDGEFNAYNLCLPCDAFVKRQYENGNLDKFEPYQFDWLPDIARDAGEPWPPEAALNTPSQEGEKI